MIWYNQFHLHDIINHKQCNKDIKLIILYLRILCRYDVWTYAYCYLFCLFLCNWELYIIWTLVSYSLNYFRKIKYYSLAGNVHVGKKTKLDENGMKIAHTTLYNIYAKFSVNSCDLLVVAFILRIQCPTRSFEMRWIFLHWLNVG